MTIQIKPISEAERQEQINKATGEATALLAVANAKAEGLQIIAKSLGIQVSQTVSSSFSR